MDEDIFKFTVECKIKVKKGRCKENLLGICSVKKKWAFLNDGSVGNVLFICLYFLIYLKRALLINK